MRRYRKVKAARYENHGSPEVHASGKAGFERAFNKSKGPNSKN
jgi:hypothetical protein